MQRQGRGEPDSRALQLGKMPTRALQFSPREIQIILIWSCRTPITQKDWSGGRGQEDFEKDKTRYSDSQNIDACMAIYWVQGDKRYTCGYFTNYKCTAR